MIEMAYLSLYRKYRPQTFDEIVGQDHVSTTLSNAIVEDRVAHSYLFTGPRGTGKTSTARILAKALNCAQGPTPRPCGVCDSCTAIADGSSLDVIEMDAASHSKVDETRDILAGVPLATAGSAKKVYVIDEVHMLSAGSFNALLKTLEEPPAHVLFILATTEAHKVLDTIISRTQRFDFRRVPADLLEAHLAKIAEAEGIAIDRTVLAEIARRAEGGVRDALSALDQLASAAGNLSAADAEVLLGDRREDAFTELFDTIAAGDLGAIFGSTQALVARGADLRQTAMGAMEHARSLLLLKTAPDAEFLLDASEEDLAVLQVQKEHFTAAALLRTIDLISKAITEMRTAPDHRLLLEVALVRAGAPETDPSANGLLGRIERLERRFGIEPGVPGPLEIPAPVAGRGQDQPLEAPSRQPGGSGGAKEDSMTGRRPAAGSEASPAPSPAVATPPSAVEGPAAGPKDVTGAGNGVPAQVGLGEIKSSWQATLQEVKQRSKRVWGMLNPSRPVALNDGAVVVEVQSPWHQAEMGEERNRSIVAESLYAALGIRPSLEFTVLRKDGGPAPEPSESAAEYSEAPNTPVPADDPIELVKKGLHAEVVEEIGER